MATSCDSCGHKSIDMMKSAGGIEPRGTKITLRVKDPSDLSRDVLKSETCSLKLPDLDFEMGGYSLGGKFTTLEGLMSNIMDQMESDPFLGSADSLTPEAAKKRLEEFSRKFRELMEGNKEFIFILDDPAGNSYLQNVYAPEQDPEMTIEHYDRTREQNEELGINAMKRKMEKNHNIEKEEENGEETDPLLLQPTEPLSALQHAHLLEIGQSAQCHMYVREQDPNMLSPARAARGEDGSNNSRRVSATKSNSKSCSGSNQEGGGGGGSQDLGR